MFVHNILVRFGLLSDHLLEKSCPLGSGDHVFSSRKQVRVTKTPYAQLLYSKTGVYRGILFLFLLQNIDCGYSLEPPHEQSMFCVCGTVSSMLSGLEIRSLGLNTLGTT